MHNTGIWTTHELSICFLSFVFFSFVLSFEGQTNEAAEMGLLQEQVELCWTDHHPTELERPGCLYQEGSAWEPWCDILPKPQRPVRPTHTELHLMFKPFDCGT